MKKKYIALVFCVMLLIPVTHARAVRSAPAPEQLRGVITATFREIVHFIDSNGVLWQNLSSEYNSTDPGTWEYPPEKIMENVASVYGSDWSTFALDEAGGLWACGNDANENQGTAGLSAHMVKILDGVAEFSMGAYYCLAVRTDGTLWFWGSAMSGSDDGRVQYHPVQVMDSVASASADGEYPLVIRHDGSLWTFNSSWNDYLDCRNFMPIKVMENISSAAAGMAIDKQSILWRFDADFSTDTYLTPIKVMDNIASVAAVWNDWYLARDTANGLWAWPTDKPGQSPAKIANNCKYIVSGISAPYLYFIDTKNTLMQVTMANGKASSTALEKDVLYAIADSDVMLACVKTDGSAMLIKHPYGESDGYIRTTICNSLLLSSRTGNAGGLPCYPGYRAEIRPTFSFDDIDGHWAEDAVLRWAGYGIIQGAEGLFRPDDTITRAEFCAVLNRLLGLSRSMGSVFADVPENAWYRQDIDVASTAGYMHGDGHGNMMPLDDITCEQAAAMLARVFSLDSGFPSTSPFENVSDWARSSVDSMYYSGYMPYNAQQYRYEFEPKAAITRAAVIDMIDRLVGLYIPDGGNFGDPDELTVIRGSVVVLDNEAVLRNIQIEGNVYILPELAAHFYRILLREVDVRGTVYTACSNEDIVLLDSTIEHICILGGALDISATGNTSVQSVAIERGTSAELDERDLVVGADGFRQVYVESGSQGVFDVFLNGDFDRLVNSGNDARITISGTVRDFYPAVPAVLSGEFEIDTTHPAGTLPAGLMPIEALGLLSEDNGAHSFASFGGTLYASTYNGVVYRLTEPGGWQRVSALEGIRVYKMTAFDGKLLITGFQGDTAGLWAYDGQTLTELPLPDGHFLDSLTVMGDTLYASCYDILYSYTSASGWQPVPGWPEGYRPISLYARDGILYVGAGIFAGYGDYGHKGDYIDGLLMAYDGQSWSMLAEPLPDEQIVAIGSLGGRIFVATSHNGYIYHRYELEDGVFAVTDDGLDMFNASVAFYEYGSVLFTGSIDSGSNTSGLHWFDEYSRRWIRTDLGYQRITAISEFEGRMIVGVESGFVFALN